jgi:hypothetical protein
MGKNDLGDDPLQELFLIILTDVQTLTPHWIDCRITMGHDPLQELFLILFDAYPVEHLGECTG